MKSQINNLLRYIQYHYIMSLVVIYIVFSSLLLLFTGIDICIPCIWKTIFNMTCPGCGLTRAFIDILQLKPASAFEHNPLIFLVIPAGLYYFYKDYSQFLKKLGQKKS